MAPTTRSTDNKEGHKPETGQDATKVPNVNPNEKNTGKANSATAIVPPEMIPILTPGTQNQTTPPTVESRLDLLIDQMNILTQTVNSVSLQFHAVKLEIVQLNTKVADIQKNQADIVILEKRVNDITESIQFNDADRNAIKDHIKTIEERQKADHIQINELKNKDWQGPKTCDCSKRLDKLEIEQKKKNLLISGVRERKGENLKGLVLEILSNTKAQIDPYSIDQTVRVGQYNPKASPRPILVKFIDLATKEAIMARKHLIKTNPNCKHIWLNDDLSEVNKRTMAEMRTLGNLAVDMGHQVLLRGNNIIIDGITYDKNSLDKLPPHLSLERAYTRDTPNGIGFHSKHSFLSSFHEAPFRFNKTSYNCSEQAIQHIKAVTHKHEAIAKQIMKETEPLEMKRLGDQITTTEEWRRSENSLMGNLVDHKFDQNPHLAKKCVPQGSILGPLLFNVYINDIVKFAKRNILLYADDSVIFDSSDDISALYTNIQAELNNIVLWCTSHKLTINVKKTKAVLFTNNKEHELAVKNNYNIYLKGEKVDHVPVYKYLGIQLDHNLKFNCQYNETYKLASHKLFMLRRLRSTVTEFTALTIVKTMLLPYLDMGNLYMSSQTAVNLNKFDVILNTALRVVYQIHKPYEAHNLDLYCRANLFSLKYRRKYFLLNMMFRLIHNGDIDLVIPLRETRNNKAPTVKTYIAINDTVGKSPVYVARDLWNKLSIEFRSIENLDAFKVKNRKSMYEAYVSEEVAKLTAGMFM